MIVPHFFYCNDIGKATWNRYGVYFSNKFCCYFADYVERTMLTECNLKPSYKVSLSAFKQENDKPMYESGPVSVLNIAISILPMFTDDLRFCWKSKTGKIIKITDEDFDEEDLECWIEGLKPKLYWEQAYSKKADHPFIIKNLPYELDVVDYGIEMSVAIYLNNADNAKSLATAVGDLIDNYNNKSLLKDREDGIVHNASYDIQDSIINYRIDLGSAGLGFIKKVLRLLTKYKEVEKVVLDL